LVEGMGMELGAILFYIIKGYITKK
ncbi:MAG: hypothetical protein RL675_424, partial [Bacteroidota bacterium]